MKTLDGILFARMINAGAANLQAHAKEINDLNVFPIPDGDTGDNMLMTMMGGVRHNDAVSRSLDEMSCRISGGMLLSARGNSGVILSQFFEGIKNGFSGLRSADTREIGEALREFCIPMPERTDGRIPVGDNGGSAAEGDLLGTVGI